MWDFELYVFCYWKQEWEWECRADDGDCDCGGVGGGESGEVVGFGVGGCVGGYGGVVMREELMMLMRMRMKVMC